MYIHDLGKIEGRMLVFGGPYSNLEATRAMRAEARKLIFHRVILFVVVIWLPTAASPMKRSISFATGIFLLLWAIAKSRWLAGLTACR